ncbi:MAG: hypothetical protein KF861_14465 [Planctomycetaceae bacterium]|nr:hypothetical protein [Planctomycetaceae bacterium]
MKDDVALAEDVGGGEGESGVVGDVVRLFADSLIGRRLVAVGASGSTAVDPGCDADCVELDLGGSGRGGTR